MATKREIAQNYAQRLRSALREAEARKAASPDAHGVYNSKIIRVFIKIADHLDAEHSVGETTKERRHFTVAEKRIIARMAGEELGLSNPDEFYDCMQSITKNAYMKMIVQIRRIMYQVS